MPDVEIQTDDFLRGLEALDLDPTQHEPSAGVPGLNLSEAERLYLEKSLFSILEAHDTAVSPKKKRLAEIEDAYNLMPDAKRAGQKPDGSRLVSELTRSGVNIATAQLLDNLVGSDELVMVQVFDDNARSDDTIELVETAEALETFLEAYAKSEVDLDQNLYRAIHALCKLGNARVKIWWEVVDETYRYRGQDGEVHEESNRVGRVQWMNIPIDQAISWPLDQTNLQKCIVSGYRTLLENFEYRSLLKKLKVGKDLTDQLLGPVTEDEDENRRKSLKGKDILISTAQPLSSRHRIIELWINHPLSEDGEAVKCQCYLDETKLKLFWADYNYHLYQTTPLFDIPYWRETDTIYASGVGHESMFSQAADSSMWNMLIDNLKLMGNFLIKLKVGSPAESMQDQISPGFRIPVEDEDDVTTLQLGGDLSHIGEAMELNDKRNMRATDINALAQGFGDPVLKSGASPGTYQNLQARTARKFRQVDKGIRMELSRIFMFMLELLQQYGATGTFYSLVDEETASKVYRIKFKPPRGDLRKLLRVTIRPPSATSNEDQLRTDLMMLYNLSVQHAQFILELSNSTWGEFDPGRIFRTMEDWLSYFNVLYFEVLKAHELPGLAAKAPQMEKQPRDELIDKLFSMLKQMKDEYEQLQSSLANAGPGLEGPGGGPQLSAVGQMPQGV